MNRSLQMYINLKNVIYIAVSCCFLLLASKQISASPIQTYSHSINIDSLDSAMVKPSKWKLKLTAVGLAIALGPFGVHRIYLGTSAFVPVAYTITLGGGFGLLPVLDIVTILVTKDLERIKNHSGVFLFLPK